AGRESTRQSDCDEASPLQENEGPAQLRLDCSPLGLGRMELVKLAIEPLVYHIVGRRNADCGNQTECYGTDEGRRVDPPQKIGEYHPGEDEYMFRAVVQASNRQIGSGSSS